MLAQIVIHTPLWVWALLAFLIYRGLLASVTRTVSFRNIFILPLLMLGLSLQGITSAFGAQPAALSAWLAGLLAAGLLTRLAGDGNVLAADPQHNRIVLRGSWMPLALMIGIFCTKYAVAATLALHPSAASSPLFVAAICALYGAFNGIFLGKLLRMVAAWRIAQPVADMPAA